MNLSLKALSLPIIVSGALVSNSATAQELYVFGSVGASETTHSIERNLGANPPDLPVPDAGGVSTVGNTGASFLLGAGARTNVGNGPVFVGLEGYYSFEDSQSRNINGVLVTDLDLKARYGARALLGVDVTDKFSAYSHAVVAILDYDLTNSYTFAPPVTERSNSDTSFSYGIGFGYRLNKRISVFTDYTKVSEVEFDGIPEIAGGTGRENPNTLSVETLSTGLRFSF